LPYGPATRKIKCLKRSVRWLHPGFEAKGKGGSANATPYDF
jgi:hypothetical protein